MKKVFASLTLIIVFLFSFSFLTPQVSAVIQCNPSIKFDAQPSVVPEDKQIVNFTVKISFGDLDPSTGGCEPKITGCSSVYNFFVDEPGALGDRYYQDSFAFKKYQKDYEFNFTKNMTYLGKKSGSGFLDFMARFRPNDCSTNWAESSDVKIAISPAGSAPGPLVSSGPWGCKASNGVYACTVNPADSGLKSTCGTYFTEQPADKCGCTDTEYSGGVKGRNCKANGGTGKLPAAGGGVTPAGTKVWACKAGDGKYSCSPSNTSTLYDVTGTGGGCEAPDAIQVDSSWCGKTDEQIKAAGAAGAGAGTGSGGSGATIDCNVPGNCLSNPLPTGSLIELFLIIARGFLYAIGLVSIVFIVVGGFRMVVSSGNEEAVGQAKKTVTWAVLGMVVALLSFSIIAIAQSLLNVNLPAAPPGVDTGYINQQKNNV